MSVKIFLRYVKLSMRHVPNLCLLLVMLILLGCSAKKTPKPSPNVSGPNKSSTIEKAVLTNEVLLPCGNGELRNQFGNCPGIPPCARRCYLNLVPNDSKDCMNHPDYEFQHSKTGGKCAWTFPPGTRVW